MLKGLICVRPHLAHKYKTVFDAIYTPHELFKSSWCLWWVWVTLMEQVLYNQRALRGAFYEHMQAIVLSLGCDYTKSLFTIYQ